MLVIAKGTVQRAKSLSLSGAKGAFIRLCQRKIWKTISIYKVNLRNLVLEGWWKPRIQLRLPAQMGGKRNIRRGINIPSKTGFMIFCLYRFYKCSVRPKHSAEYLTEYSAKIVANCHFSVGTNFAKIWETISLIKVKYSLPCEISTNKRAMALYTCADKGYEKKTCGVVWPQLPQ